MKKYDIPKIIKIGIEPGIAFAAYTCYQRITWNQYDGVCKADGDFTPENDGYDGGNPGCWYNELGQ